MIERVNSFVTSWWLGLIAPWRRHDSAPNLIRIENNKVISPIEHAIGAPIVISIPDNHVLTSKIKNDQTTVDIESAISHSLPFESDELYATMSDSTLYAVLKSDVSRWLDQIESDNVQPTYLQFDQTNPPLTLPLSAPQPNYKPLVLTTLSVTLLAVSIGFGLTYLRNTNQTLLKELDARIISVQTALSQYRHPVGLEEAYFDSNTARYVLQELSQRVNEQIDISQISLSKVNGKVVVIMDAQADNSTVLLSKLDQHSKFSDTKFISAISTSGPKQKERFRIQTTYSLEHTVSLPVGESRPIDQQNIVPIHRLDRDSSK